MWSLSPDHPLRRMLAGLTEHAFLDELGIGDPPLVDYISAMLSRFINMDEMYQLHDLQGRRLEEVADMMMEAESLPAQGRTRREIYRHIGDYTLFWTGVYPEAVARMQSILRKDHFLDYCEQGKRSFYIASTFDDEQFRDEALVLRRLSDEFMLCAYGLNQVRREWEKSGS